MWVNFRNADGEIIYMEDKKYSINEVFSLLDEEGLKAPRITKGFKKGCEITVDGYPVYSRSLRYSLFYQKGCDCVKCGRKGSYFKLDITKDNPERRHFNLYTEDNILMTKDHIKPKVAGGKDIIENLQPMCSICNSEKSGEYPGVVKLTHVKSGKIRYFKNLEEATQQLIIDQFSQKCKKKSFKDTTKLIINTVYKIQEAYTTGAHYMNYKWEICE